MNKKLTAKIQKLFPTLEETAQVISTSIAIEPLEKELVLKKGNIYCVFDANSPATLNVSLVTNVVNDILYESYYHSDNISPIQSLEKAILNVNEKITNLSIQASQEQKIDTKEKKPIFNMIAGVLWGNVCYIVQYGKAKGFFMREGEIKEVRTTSEGSFSVSSGVVKEDDVVIFGTEKFSEKYPPEKLLQTALSAKDLEPDQSCMILKLIIDTEFTEDEVIDFNVSKDKKPTKLASFVEKFKSLSAKKTVKEVQVDTISSLSTIPINTKDRDLLKEKPNIKIRTPGKIKLGLDSKYLVYFILFLLLISIAATVFIQNNKQKDAEEEKTANKANDTLTMPVEPAQKEPETPKPDEKTPEQLAQEQTAQDLQTKTQRIANQVFYDLKLADPNADPNSLAVFKSTLAASDFKSGKVFTSDLGTPKFAALESTFVGIKNAYNFENKLNFIDNEGFKVFDLVSGKVEATYPGKFGVTNRYLGNIYSLEENKIIKYVPSGTTLTSSTWAESNDFKDAKSLAVAYNIYALSANSNLLVYTQGNKATFEIKGLETPFKNAVQIVADVTFDNLYIADAGNQRVVVLSAKGDFIKQYKAEKDTDWSDIRSITIDASESKMYLLNSSKVYEIDLTK